jgi:hypothetical protein
VVKRAPTEQELEKARALLKAKQYGKAREVLAEIEHPLADQWIEQIDIVLGGQLQNIGGLNAVSYDDQRGMDSVYVGDLIRPLDRPRISALPAYGFALLVFTALLGGAFTGLLLFSANKLAYVAVVSVWIAATIAGWMMGIAVRAGGVRSTSSAFWLGLLMGVVFYGTFSYLDYRSFLQQSALELGISGANIDMEVIEDTVNEVLERRTGYEGIIGYKLLPLEERIVFVNLRVGPDAPVVVDNPPDHDFALAILGFEALIALFVPARMASRSARDRRRRQPNVAVQPA